MNIRVIGDRYIQLCAENDSDHSVMARLSHCSQADVHVRYDYGDLTGPGNYIIDLEFKGRLGPCEIDQGQLDAEKGAAVVRFEPGYIEGLRYAEELLEKARVEIEQLES